MYIFIYFRMFSSIYECLYHPPPQLGQQLQVLVEPARRPIVVAPILGELEEPRQPRQSKQPMQMATAVVVVVVSPYSGTVQEAQNPVSSRGGGLCSQSHQGRNQFHRVCSRWNDRTC